MTASHIIGFIYDHVKELVHLGLVRSRKEGSTKVLTTTHRFSETFGISSVSKKKVKGHVKSKVLAKIERVTLDRYEGTSEEEEEDEESEEEEDEEE